VSIELPADLLAYVVEKGSIAIDGISLTVARLNDSEITIGLIPETLQRTTLGKRAVGDAVNIEVDVIAKYVERLLEARLS
jgi:riboflavin synthase